MKESEMLLVFRLFIDGVYGTFCNVALQKALSFHHLLIYEEWLYMHNLFLSATHFSSAIPC